MARGREFQIVGVHGNSEAARTETYADTRNEQQLFSQTNARYEMGCNVSGIEVGRHGTTYFPVTSPACDRGGTKYCFKFVCKFVTLQCIQCS